MGFSKKIKAYFDAKGLSNREVAKIMDYNESLVSRYNNSDKISSTYISILKKYFTDIDWNYMLNDDEDKFNILNEPSETYGRNPDIIIKEIEDNLNELKNFWRNSATIKN